MLEGLLLMTVLKIEEKYRNNPQKNAKPIFSIMMYSFKGLFINNINKYWTILDPLTDSPLPHTFKCYLWTHYVSVMFTCMHR